MSKETTGTRTVTGRALSVLDTFDVSHRRQSLAAISRRSGLPLTTVHRLVHELEKHHALVRGSDGDYEIGDKIWRLGILASVHSDLREIALPYMEDVYGHAHDSVQIAVLDGLRCLVVERIAGTRTLTTRSRPGSRLPLHATAVGKVLLAFGDDELKDAVCNSLERFTDNTITDETILRSQLKTIHARGYAESDEELDAGAVSVAVPLRGKGGKVIAALGVVCPADKQVLSRMLPIMQVTGAALSRKLAEVGMTAASRLPLE